MKEKPRCQFVRITAAFSDSLRRELATSRVRLINDDPVGWGGGSNFGPKINNHDINSGDLFNRSRGFLDREHETKNKPVQRGNTATCCGTHNIVLDVLTSEGDRVWTDPARKFLEGELLRPVSFELGGKNTGLVHLVPLRPPSFSRPKLSFFFGVEMIIGTGCAAFHVKMFRLRGVLAK